MKNGMYDYLIVGSGVFGSVFAYAATKQGKKCLVIDKKYEVGGSCVCQCIDGINVHSYGPHIFHTSNKEIWEFINNFAEFNRFTYEPLAYNGVDKRYYHLPFNMNTFNEIWPDVTTPEQARAKIQKEIVPFENPSNLEEQAISLVGPTIYGKLIKGYTEKQWGKPCTELPPEIIKRLPLRFSYSNNYFDDKYQGCPIGGYNPIFYKLLAGIPLMLGCDYFSDRKYFDGLADKLVYTGKIDEYYEYRFGPLEYRSLSWKHTIIDTSSYQGTCAINYTTNDVPYTRSIEHKYFEMLTDKDINSCGHTVLTREFPEDYNGENEPYYPINTPENQDKYAKYKQLADNEKDVIFGGRLAGYRYMNMDETIESALSHFSEKPE